MKICYFAASLALAGCTLDTEPDDTAETEEASIIPPADCFGMSAVLHDAWTVKGYNPGAFYTADSWAGYSYWQYAGGMIVQNPFGCAHEMHGSIYGEWSRLGGLSTNPLGAPTTNESVTAYSPSGRYNLFEHGEIEWTAATGAHELRGAIYDHFAAMGRNRSWLEFPLTGALSSGVAKGDHQDFHGGSIYIDKPVDYFWGGPPHPGIAVFAPIRDHWLATLGGPFNPTFSFPIVDSQWYADVDVRTPFTGGGTIFYHPAYGAWGLFGSVLQKWRDLGGTGSQAGFPTSDAAYDKQHVLSATFANGIIIENPHTGTAHWIPGKLAAQWPALRAVIGYPVNEAYPSAGGMYQFFEGGVLYSRESTHAVLYAGHFLEAYWGVNAEWGSLGFPINEQQPCGLGSFQNFTNGMIYNPGGGGSAYARIGAARGACSTDRTACVGQTFQMCTISNSSTYSEPGTHGSAYFTCTWEDAKQKLDHDAPPYSNAYGRRYNQTGTCPSLPPNDLGCGGTGQTCCGNETCFGIGVCQGICREPCYDYNVASCGNAGSVWTDLPDFSGRYDSGSSEIPQTDDPKLPEPWR